MEEANPGSPRGGDGHPEPWREEAVSRRLLDLLVVADGKDDLHPCKVLSAYSEVQMLQLPMGTTYLLVTWLHRDLAKRKVIYGPEDVVPIFRGSKEQLRQGAENWPLQN